MNREVELQRYIESNMDTFVAEIRELAFTIEDSKSLNYPKYLKHLIIDNITAVNYVNSHEKLYIDNEHHIIPDILLKDEGVGVRVIQELMDNYTFPTDIQLIDGGTLGPHLLNLIKGFEEIRTRLH